MGLIPLKQSEAACKHCQKRVIPWFGCKGEINLCSFCGATPCISCEEGQVCVLGRIKLISAHVKKLSNAVCQLWKLEVHGANRNIGKPRRWCFWEAHCMPASYLRVRGLADPGTWHPSPGPCVTDFNRATSIQLGVLLCTSVSPACLCLWAAAVWHLAPWCLFSFLARAWP